MLRRHACLAILCCTLPLYDHSPGTNHTGNRQKPRQARVGVNTGLAGFATVGPDGKWHGFDVDYCRALAAAIFNMRTRWNSVAYDTDAFSRPCSERNRLSEP